MGEMRCLSIMQPWLGAIVLGDKRVENRSWAAPQWIIGETIALHASKRFDWGAEFPPGRNLMWYAPEDLPLGAVTGIATVTGCHLSPDFGGTCGATRPLCSPWAARDSYHWLLSDVRALPEPVSCRGMLGLWRLPDDVDAAVRAQLGEDGEHG